MAVLSEQAAAASAGAAAAGAPAQSGGGAEQQAAAVEQLGAAPALPEGTAILRSDVTQGIAQP